MNTKHFLAGWFGLFLASPMPAFAQQPATRMGGLMLSVFAGGAANTDLQRTEARAEWLAPGGLQSRRFARRLTAETSGALGVTAAYWFNPFWGIRAQAAVAPSRLEITVSERETHDIPPDTTVTGPSQYGAFRVWTYDAELLFRAPITPRGRIAVYGFVGGGLVNYDASVEEGLPPEAAPTFADGKGTKQPAVLFGVGALVPLHRNKLGLSFELSDHVSRTPVRRSPETVAIGNNSVLVTTSQDASSSGVRLINHVRLSMGLTWRAR